MTQLHPDRLEELLDRFAALTIGLVGDLFLDRYLDIDPALEEISIETGLPAHQVVAVRNAAGAMGTVLNNLAALGVGRLMPISVIGDDGHGDDLLRCLSGMPVDRSGLLRCSDRLTPTYTKPLQRLADGSVRELNRLDVRTRIPLDESIHRDLAAHLRQVFASCDGWVVLDQVPEAGTGVVDDRLHAVLRDLAARDARCIVVDSRRRLGQFSFGSLKGNQAEFLHAVQRSGDSLDTVVEASRQLASHTGRTAFCTVGEQGMLVAEPGGAVWHVSGVRVEGPVDIVGAGDAATSGIVTALLAGASAWEAAAVGNLAASITVQQIGTTGVATQADLRRRLREAGSPRITPVG